MYRIVRHARSTLVTTASAVLLLGLAVALPAAADTTHATAARTVRAGDAYETAAPWVVAKTYNRRRPATPPRPSYTVENGLTANAVAVHRAGLQTWPQIVTYYGYRNDPSSDHYTGKALDLMIPSYTTTAGRSVGQKVAEWAVANQPELHIQYVIWDQHIWNVSRAGDGWRLMADRGSDSANHKNHVHISVM